MGDVDLDAIPLFAGLEPEDREQAAAVAREVHWEAGQIALGDGEFAFDFYAIKHGAMDVMHGTERVATLGDGDFFGEIGLVGNGLSNASRRRSATVVATAPTSAVAISRSDMRRLSDAIPALRDAVNRAAAERSQR